MNTTDFLLQNVIDDHVALITPKEEYTYRDLKKSTLAILDTIQSMGIQMGDRVGIIGNNSLLWVASYLAIMKLGGIVVPFAIKLTQEELAAQIKFVRCKNICIEKRFIKRYSSVLTSYPSLIDEQFLEKNNLGSWQMEISPFNETLDAAWMLTSGTTAKPRVVRITHRNIQANTNSIIQYLGITETERIMAVLPFYYCFGTSLLHTHLRAGGSLVLGDAVVFPEKVLDLMEEKGCTGFAGVPSTFQMYLRNSTFPNRPLNTLRKIQQAGGKLSNVLIEELVRCRPKAKIFVMYGQTEATARLSFLNPDMVISKLGSIGNAIPGVILKVVNEAGKDIKPGEIGEIVAWGDNISPGYLNEPEANEKKFENGSLRTGDIATIDEDGYLYIVDRKSDFIKSYGNRVSSQEIEACILELKEVVTVAVIGVPDLVRGEAIRAFVVLRSGAVLTEKDILSHCTKRLARFMVPNEVFFLKALPTNPHGKIIKSDLRKLEEPKPNEKPTSNTI